MNPEIRQLRDEVEELQTLVRKKATPGRLQVLNETKLALARAEASQPYADTAYAPMRRQNVRVAADKTAPGLIERLTIDNTTGARRSEFEGSPFDWMNQFAHPARVVEMFPTFARAERGADGRFRPRRS